MLTNSPGSPFCRRLIDYAMFSHDFDSLMRPVSEIGAVSVCELPTLEDYNLSPHINVPLDVSTFTSEGYGRNECR